MCWVALGMVEVVAIVLEYITCRTALLRRYSLRKDEYTKYGMAMGTFSGHESQTDWRNKHRDVESSGSATRIPEGHRWSIHEKNDPRGD